MLDAAKAGDALALESLNKSCYYLGWALATISMVLDPQAFLIGGGVSKAGTFLTDIIKRYHDELSPMATKKADIVLAKLGNDARNLRCREADHRIKKRESGDGLPFCCERT